MGLRKILQSLEALGKKVMQMFDVPCVGEDFALFV
jgi:hypothetical protein